MSERPEIVLSDVDGTQIVHGQKLPSTAVQAAARSLRANGIHLLEVTSRSHEGMRRLIEPLDLQNNLCTLDGGATVAHADSGEVEWSQWLSAERTRAVILGIGGLCTKIHYDMDSRGRSPAEVLAAIQSEEVATAPSVFAIFGVEKGPEIITALSGVAGIKHTRIMGYEDIESLRCIQVVDAGVDKQYGIEQMLYYGNLSDRPRLIIGDGENDLPMFTAARPSDIKVAIGNKNTPEELRGLADWVAPPVEKDGFVRALERYGLI